MKELQKETNKMFQGAEESFRCFDQRNEIQNENQEVASKGLLENATIESEPSAGSTSTPVETMVAHSAMSVAETVVTLVLQTPVL